MVELGVVKGSRLSGSVQMEWNKSGNSEMKSTKTRTSVVVVEKL